MILVTGGTGLLGSHLLLRLLRDGHRVRALHRKDSDIERVQKVFGFYGNCRSGDALFSDTNSRHISSDAEAQKVASFKNNFRDGSSAEVSELKDALFEDDDYDRLCSDPDTFENVSPKEDSSALFHKIEWVEADITDIPALEKAFEGITHVYHAAALISFDPRDYKKLQKINAEGTANIVNLCIYRKVQKLCYASTIGAIGKNLTGDKASEETAWTPREANVYGLSKHAAEMEVWRGSQEGVPVTIVNPGVIIGPGFWDSGSGALFTTAQKTYDFYPPGGTGFISVHDVVDMMIALMESNIQNERYIAVAENWSYQKILTEITSELGLKPPRRKLKFWQLEIGRWFDWLGNLLFNNGRSITKSHIRSLRHRQIFDNSKVKEQLDFEFRPLQEEIRFCCSKFKEKS